VREGSDESTACSPAFSVPFVQPRAQVVAEPRAPAPAPRPELPPCFLEYSEEIGGMEA
jgi:hypothetical protein